MSNIPSSKFHKFIPKKTPAPKPVEASAEGGPDQVSEEKVYSNVPGREPVELVRSYSQFADYYPNCELETKGWCARNVQSDWVVLDCGANVGYYSILFSQLASEGRVFSFEPTATHDLLMANLNHHQCANVEALRVGLGRESGVKQERIFRIWGQEPDLEDFSFTSIDDFVMERGLERLDCIKIDVDSYDFEVLQGAEKTLEKLNPWVLIEVNYALRKRGVEEATVYKWLGERGYTDALVLDSENLIMRRGLEPQGTHHSAAVPFRMWLG